MTEFTSMTESIILCQKCTRRLNASGGESNPGEGGYTEHFHCNDCNVGIDVIIKFNKVLEMSDELTGKVKKD